MKNHGMDWIGRWLAASAIAVCAGCARLKVEPVEVNVQPIHVTVDVNVKVQKVDRALDDFFSDISGPTTDQAPAGAEKNAKEKQP